MTRFRATYQRRIAKQGGDTIHTLIYPTSNDLFPGSGLLGGFALQVPAAVGTVVEAPDGTATARTTDGTDLDLPAGADVDTAIDALIKHDQALYN